MIKKRKRLNKKSWIFKGNSSGFDKFEDSDLKFAKLHGKDSIISNNKITVESHLNISENVNCNIECKGTVVIDKTGHVQGDIKAKELVLRGTFKGNVWVENNLSILNTAHISGYASAANLYIEEGAFCQVDLNIDSHAGQRYEHATLVSEPSNEVTYTDDPLSDSVRNENKKAKSKSSKTGKETHKVNFPDEHSDNNNSISYW